MRATGGVVKNRRTHVKSCVSGRRRPKRSPHPCFLHRTRMHVCCLRFHVHVHDRRCTHSLTRGVPACHWPSVLYIWKRASARQKLAARWTAGRSAWARVPPTKVCVMCVCARELFTLAHRVCVCVCVCCVAVCVRALMCLRVRPDRRVFASVWGGRRRVNNNI